MDKRRLVNGKGRDKRLRVQGNFTNSGGVVYHLSPGCTELLVANVDLVPG